MLRPELFENGDWHLPLIHHVHALANAPGLWEDETARHKIQTVVDFCSPSSYERKTKTCANERILDMLVTLLYNLAQRPYAAHSLCEAT